MKFERKRRELFRLAATGLLLFPILLSVSLVAETAKMYPPTIVFMTDFGVVDDSVAICRAVLCTASCRTCGSWT